MPEGIWAFLFQDTGGPDDEAGYCFGSDSFLVGGSASICDDTGLHMFHVATVEPV